MPPRDSRRAPAPLRRIARAPRRAAARYHHALDMLARCRAMAIIIAHAADYAACASAASFRPHGATLPPRPPMLMGISDLPTAAFKKPRDISHRTSAGRQPAARPALASTPPTGCDIAIESPPRGFSRRQPARARQPTDMPCIAGRALAHMDIFFCARQAGRRRRASHGGWCRGALRCPPPARARGC